MSGSILGTISSSGFGGNKHTSPIQTEEKIAIAQITTTISFIVLYHSTRMYIFMVRRYTLFKIF